MTKEDKNGRRAKFKEWMRNKKMSGESGSGERINSVNKQKRAESLVKSSKFRIPEQPKTIQADPMEYNVM